MIITAVRATHFAAAVVIFGELAFFYFVARPLFSADESTFAQIVRRTKRSVTWALGLTAVSGLAWLVLKSAEMSGTPLGNVGLDTLGTVLGRTVFGNVWLTRFVVLIALAGVLWLQPRISARSASNLAVGCCVALGGVLLASLAWAGHAQDARGVERIMRLAADSVHLLAAGAWLGALLPLAFTLKSSNAAAAAARFSLLGMTAVSAVIATGLVNAWYTVGSWPALVGTYYGRLLVLKLLLFGAMLALAIVNRTRLTPLLSTAALRPRAGRTLRRNAIAELILGLAILIVVGALGAAVPAAHVQAVWPFSYSLSWELAQRSPATWEALWAALAVVAIGIALIIYAIAKTARWRTLSAGVAILVPGLAAAAWLLAVPAHPTTYFHSPVGYSAASIARGERLFARNCAVCHGDQGLMGTKKTLLAAVSPQALPFLRNALGQSIQLVPVHTLADAIRRLKDDTDVALIVSTVYFDESRMFDLLQIASEKEPKIPFICCRVSAGNLTLRSTEALATAAESLGAAAFIDLLTLAQELGSEAAHQQFQRRVLAHLPSQI